jgi:biopolymer transport protein ExbD
VAPDAKERKPDKNQRTVNVRWNKNEQKALMTFGGLEWQDREGLAEELRKIADTMPDGKGGTRLEILVRADRATPAKEVQAAIAVIAQSTAAVAYATHNR